VGEAVQNAQKLEASGKADRVHVCCKIEARCKSSFDFEADNEFPNAFFVKARKFYFNKPSSDTVEDDSEDEESQLIDDDDAPRIFTTQSVLSNSSESYQIWDAVLRIIERIIAFTHCYHPTISTLTFYSEVLLRYLTYLKFMLFTQMVIAFIWVGLVMVIDWHTVSEWKLPFVAVMFNAVMQSLMFLATLIPFNCTGFDNCFNENGDTSQNSIRVQTIIIVIVLNLSNAVHVIVMVLFITDKSFAKYYAFSHALWIGIQMVRNRAAL